jgi:hypothetical protein
MISKQLTAHSFYHTCRYIASKPGAEWLVAEGVRSHDYKLMAEDFNLQQSLRPTKKLACFHGILSFYPGEKPTDDTMKNLAETYLQNLGIINTQYAVCKHTDRAHLHLHIVANMVDYNGKAIKDGWLGLKGKKIAQELTRTYGLVVANEKNLKLTNLQSLNDYQATRYKIYMGITAVLSRCRSIDELKTELKQQGIETIYKYKGQTNELQGISFKMGEISIKGSAVDRKFSLRGLQIVMSGLKNKEQKPSAPAKQGTSQHASTQHKSTERSQSAASEKHNSLLHDLIQPVHDNPALNPDLSKSEEEKRRRKRKSRGLGR